MMRSGYNAVVRPWRDSDLTAEIKWVRCLPGVPELGYESAIMPLRWCPYPYLAHGVGEVFDSPQPWNRGTPIPGADGKKVCGTEQDFRDGGQYLPDLPPVEYTPEGLSLCCGEPPGGILLSGFGLIQPAGSALVGGGVVTVGYGPGPAFPLEVQPAIAYISFVTDASASAAWWWKAPPLTGGTYRLVWGVNAPYNIGPSKGVYYRLNPSGPGSTMTFITTTQGSALVTIPAGWYIMLVLNTYIGFTVAMQFSLIPT